MKKIYRKPRLHSITINTEIIIAGSNTMNIYDNITVSDKDALGNHETNLDIWGNESNTIW